MIAPVADAFSCTIQRNGQIDGKGRSRFGAYAVQGVLANGEEISLTKRPPLLPEALTEAAKWFRTARGLAVIVRGDSGAAPLARTQTLGHLASMGRQQIQGVLAMQSSYPPGSLVTITRRLLKWRYEISCWDAARLGTTQYQDEACQQIKTFKPTWLEHRAKQRKKRTCSMCGKTAPNSSRAFDYCGGCRDPSIPRVDRPRYCSEECQRAHWLAGHMNECPSCTG